MLAWSVRGRMKTPKKKNHWPPLGYTLLFDQPLPGPRATYDEPLKQKHSQKLARTISDSSARQTRLDIPLFDVDLKKQITKIPLPSGSYLKNHNNNNNNNKAEDLSLPPGSPFLKKKKNSKRVRLFDASK